VKVPKKNLIGEKNQGGVAVTTLMFEADRDTAAAAT